MSTPPAGWFPGPENPKQTRWCAGQQWTEQTATPPPTGILPPPATTFATAAAKRKRVAKNRSPVEASLRAAERPRP
ncbi:DUF2510 domain-containing protein [uncultured Microbacterium sp.]|uniref:DUF2510 domain-containing protein n=1 Tax=Microbacterium oxydans TaxID=82380 RepID=UPI0009EBFB1A